MAAKKMDSIPTLGLKSAEQEKKEKKERKEKRKRKAEALEAEAEEEAPTKKAKKEKKEKKVEAVVTQSGAEWRKENGINMTGEFEDGFPEPFQTFSACPFDPRILATLASSGFEAPTPV
jgi:hypothetical protein